MSTNEEVLEEVREDLKILKAQIEALDALVRLCYTGKEVNTLAVRIEALEALGHSGDSITCEETKHARVLHPRA